jgi:quercetin dioxygenase-like cupin family protein
LRAMESSFALGPGEGEGFPIADGLGSARVLGELPDAEAVELSFEPGWEGVDPHSHDDHTDSFYVLEGEVEFLVGGERQRGGPGTYVSIPPGIVHGFRIAGEDRIRLLNLHTPKIGFVERLRP